jgi:predicted transposase YdaD
MPVFVTVVYFRPHPVDKKVATCFHEEFMGQTVHQDFKVIALWELDAQKALAFNNPAMLPFVPLMQGGNTVEMLQTCAERIRQEEHADELEMFLGLLAGYVLDRKLVQQILRFNMEFVENSPVFQDILAQLTEKIRQKMTEEVRQKVRQEVREEVRQEVREESRQGMLNALQQLLASRFSVGITHFDKRFQSLDLKSFEELFKIALNAQTLAEFENVLNDTLSSKELSERSVDKG